MSKNKKITVKGTAITILVFNEIDYISLTDMTIGFNEGSGLIEIRIIYFLPNT